MIENKLAPAGFETVQVGGIGFDDLAMLYLGDGSGPFGRDTVEIPRCIIENHVAKVIDAKDGNRALARTGTGQPQSPAIVAFLAAWRVARVNLLSIGILQAAIHLFELRNLRSGQTS